MFTIYYIRYIIICNNIFLIILKYLQYNTLINEIIVLKFFSLFWCYSPRTSK